LNNVFLNLFNARIVALQVGSSRKGTNEEKGVAMIDKSEIKSTRLKKEYRQKFTLSKFNIQ